MKTTFPSNPAASLILAEIGTMLHFVEGDNQLAIGILAQVQQRVPVKNIVNDLAGQLPWHRESMARCIGIRLVEKIEKYKMINI